MSIWFEGSQHVACSVEHVRRTYDDVGAAFLGLVSRMPGLSQVELVDATAGEVTIRTNEGMMRRTGIEVRPTSAGLSLEYDEEYRAGSRITATSHFAETFTASGEGVTHRLVMTDVAADGVLGFMYRRFAAKRIGKALLQATARHLEG